jgi:hypothetical protein
VAGDWTKSKLKDIKKARSGPSDKNCVEVNNKSVEEVNLQHSCHQEFCTRIIVKFTDLLCYALSVSKTTHIHTLLLCLPHVEERKLQCRSFGLCNIQCHVLSTYL